MTEKIQPSIPETNYLAEDYNPYIVSEFSLAAGECVYGLGERFTAFVKTVRL